LYFYDIILYMILKVLIGVIILIGVYFYMFRPTPLQNHIEEPTENPSAQFISSDSFVGAKKGYVFKNCSKGLGYYLDN
jgi:hypothetical protein